MKDIVTRIYNNAAEGVGLSGFITHGFITGCVMLEMGIWSNLEFLSMKAVLFALI